jgi:hypothetical protein
MVAKRTVQDFEEAAEKPREAPTKELVVQDKTTGEPAWKVRNRERKDKGIVLRCSESQIKLLQMAKKHQEISIQRILEKIVWPVLEEQYGVTEKDAPS